MVIPTFENSSNDWHIFMHLAQERMTSQDAECELNLTVQRIYQNIQIMNGSAANLLALNQSFSSVINENSIAPENKTLLAAKIQEALQGKEVDSNSVLVLKQIQATVAEYLYPEKKAASPQDTHSASSVSSRMASPSPALNNLSETTAWIIKSPSTFVFSDGEVKLDESLQKLLMENSAYFKCIWLASGFKEQGQEKLPFEDVAKEDFELLVISLKQADLVTLNLQEAANLLGISNYFQVSSLKEKCLQTIMQEFIEIFSNVSSTWEDWDDFFKIHEAYKSIPELSDYFREVMENKPDQLLAFLRKSNKSFVKFLNDLPIKSLKLENHDVSDEDLAFLENLPHLEKLDLQGCKKIAGQGLAMLPASLKELDLSSCNQLIDEDLVFLKNLTHLEKLILQGCNQITGQGLAMLPASLKELDLNFCPQLTDEDLAAFLENLIQLEKLELFRCQKITGEGLAKLPTSLKELELRSCDQLTDGALIYLNHLIHLEKLNLDNKKIIIKGLAKLSTSLKELNLGHCSQLTDEGLALLKNLIHLEKLNLDNKKIIIKGLANLGKNRP